MPYQRSSESFSWDTNDSAMLRILRSSNTLVSCSLARPAACSLSYYPLFSIELVAFQSPPSCEHGCF